MSDDEWTLVYQSPRIASGQRQVDTPASRVGQASDSSEFFFVPEGSAAPVASSAEAVSKWPRRQAVINDMMPELAIERAQRQDRRQDRRQDSEQIAVHVQRIYVQRMYGNRP